MADIVDLTMDREPHDMRACLANSKRPDGPAPIGSCHWCDEDLEGDARWCDAECRDNWHTEQEARRRR